MQAVTLGTFSIGEETSVLNMRRKLLAVAQYLSFSSAKAAQLVASTSDYAKVVSHDGPLTATVTVTGLNQLHELCLEFLSSYPGEERWLALGFDRVEPLNNGERRGWRACCRTPPIAMSEAAISWCKKVLAEQTTEELVEALNANNQALKSNEQLFRSIFENAQTGISVFNVPAGKFHTNEALHAMLRCTHEDLSSVENWDLIVHPDDRAAGAKRYAELFEGRRDVDEYTQRFLRRDGQIVTATGRFTMIRDAEGKPKYVIALHEDITERKRAEEDLRRANFLAETAMELTKAGYWHVPLDGSGWYNSSPRRAALFGDLPHPDYRYRLDEFFTNAEEGDEAAARVARQAFQAAVEGKAHIYNAVYALQTPY
jgi:PAS domain S-box-containing protein